MMTFQVLLNRKYYGIKKAKGNKYGHPELGAPSLYSIRCRLNRLTTNPDGKGRLFTETDNVPHSVIYRKPMADSEGPHSNICGQRLSSENYPDCRSLRRECKAQAYYQL
jgi:hypothetical protein